MTRATASPFLRLGRLAYRRRRAVVAGWATALVVFGGVLSANFARHTIAEDHTIRGTDSARAERLLAQRFDRPVDELAVVTFDSDTLQVDDLAFKDAVATTLGRLDRIDAHQLLVDVVGPYDTGAQGQISGDRQAALAVVALDGTADERRELLPRLAEAVSTDRGPVRVHVTGETAVRLAVDKQSDEDIARAETIGLPVAAAVLLLGFGALLAAALPIALAVAGIVITFGVLGVAAYTTDFVSLTESATTLIGLGIGIDFAMFLVARFREASRAGETVEEAVATAVATSGRSVFFSAGTVVIAVTGLFLVDNGTFHDLALGVMAAALVMATAALTLLPALLATFGPRVVRRRDRSPRPEASARTSPLWDRWAGVVMRRPVLTGAASVAVLGILALPLTDVTLGLNSGAATIRGSDAGKGLAVLETRFSSGALSPITVVIAADRRLGDADLETIDQFGASLQADPEVASVSTVATALRAHDLPVSSEALDRLVALDRAAADVVARERDATTMTVAPRHRVDGQEAQALVRRIRSQLGERAADAGLTVAVTGHTAGVVDLAGEIGSEVPWVFAYVLGVSLLLLLLVFRSPLLALKAIVMNLLSVGAAYGLLVWVFQHGHGEGLLGFTSDGTIQAWLPIVAFAILFGISMDYEVFLLGRMREEWDRTGDNEAAVRAGLSRTARPITSAAAIQIAVFGAFVFTKVPEVQQLGFVLATAIAIDATLVRVILVPAAMRLMGRANWWAPRWLPAPRPDVAQLTTRGNPPAATGASAGAPALGLRGLVADLSVQPAEGTPGSATHGAR